MSEIDDTAVGETLKEMLGPDAAARIEASRREIDAAFRAGRPHDIHPNVLAARHAIDDELAQAIAHNREGLTQARHLTKRMNTTIIVLALALALTLIVGVTTAVFLVLRSNDLQNLGDRIREAETATAKTEADLQRTAQQHEADDAARLTIGCTLLHVIEKEQTNADIRNAAAQALHQLNCP